MKQPTSTGMVVSVLLLLVAGEAALVQGRAVAVPITEYRTSLPLRRDGTSYNGSYMANEQGICSVEGVTESDANVSQAYHCFARRQDSLPPLLLDGDESGGRWNTSEVLANYYILPASVAEAPFITLTVPGNWCISALNLTFYNDTHNSISPPSNLVLQSSNASSYKEERDREFTQSSYTLSENRVVLSFDLAHDVCDVYFKIELSGCRACSHYYLSEVNAVHMRPNGTMPSANGNSTIHNNSTKSPSLQGLLPWYVQLFQGENLTYVFIGLSVLAAGILLCMVVYFCCAVACCVKCYIKRSQRTNPAEKDYAVLEFLPASAAVVLKGYHKKESNEASVEAEVSEGSINLPDTNSDAPSISLNLHTLPLACRPVSTEQEEEPGEGVEPLPGVTTADERECLPVVMHQDAAAPSTPPSRQQQRRPASMPVGQKIQECTALNEPDYDSLTAVHPPSHMGRTASGNPIIVPIAANGYAYLNSIHTTAEGYSYIHTASASEQKPARPHSYGGCLFSNEPEYANSDIIAQKAGAIKYGDKEYAEIDIPEDPAEADPVLLPKASGIEHDYTEIDFPL